MVLTVIVLPGLVIYSAFIYFAGEKAKREIKSGKAENPYKISGVDMVMSSFLVHSLTYLPLIFIIANLLSFLFSLYYLELPHS